MLSSQQRMSGEVEHETGGPCEVVLTGCKPHRSDRVTRLI
jgi:hypothetical protein